MASIQQAAKWMVQGHVVWDPMGFPMKRSPEHANEIVMASDDSEGFITLSDLLSDKWEIAND